MPYYDYIATLCDGDLATDPFHALRRAMVSVGMLEELYTQDWED